MLLFEGLSNLYKIRSLIHERDNYTKAWKVWNTSSDNYQEGWPETCFGKNQSPIDILTKTAETVTLSPIVYTNYDLPQDVFIENTGHGVKVSFGDKSVTISGGILEDAYVLDNVHFHWNSEHTLNGQTYPLESHFVHRLKAAGSLENALKYTYGVAVIAVFYEFSLKETKTFDTITKRVECIATNIKQPLPLDEQVVPKDFLPKTTCHYYAYTGSLTTPNCNEPVQWIIFPKPSKISLDQFAALKDIYNEDNIPIVRNARPLQPLNGRIIKHVKENCLGNFFKKKK